MLNSTCGSHLSGTVVKFLLSGTVVKGEKSTVYVRTWSCL